MIRKHGVLMLILCLAPVLGLGALALLDIEINTLLLAGLFVLCPLSHFLMMKSMHTGSGHEISQKTPRTLEE